MISIICGLSNRVIRKHVQRCDLINFGEDVMHGTHESNHPSQEKLGIEMRFTIRMGREFSRIVIEVPFPYMEN